jgi:hypothetical protein
MKINSQFLKQHSFELVGKLGFGKSFDKLAFDVKSESTKPGVYLWLTPKNSGYEVQYAGKAGSGPKRRMQQHEQGINKPDARERRDRICECFDKKSQSLEIWFRVSKCAPVGSFSDKSVSFYSTEEEALIAEFNPPLNRAKSPNNNSIEGIEVELLDSGGAQKDLWINVHQAINRKALNQVLKLLEGNTKKEWKNLDFKIIGQYTLKDSPALANKCLLVFGKLIRNNFSANQKYFLITLEGETKVGILNALLPIDSRNVSASKLTSFSCFSPKELIELLKKTSLNLNYLKN